MATNDVLNSRQIGTIPAGSLLPLLWLAICGLGMIAFFWRGLVSLGDAWAQPEYSHGYLIPVIAAFLLLSRLRTIEDRTPTIRWVGVVVVLVGLGTGAVGNLAVIPDIITYGFLVCVAGLVLAAAGLSTGLRLWAPIVYLGFMLPLPAFLYLQLSTKLQTISSQIGAWFITMFDVPVHLDGNIIDLGVYQLQVAEACSGLNYLFPLMSFGFLFGVLYRGPTWHKIVLFLSSVPITVFMNSVRIGIIGLLVDRYGIEQAEGFLHAFEGWVIFVACLAVLFVEAWLLQRLTRTPRPLTQMLDLSTDGLADQLRRLASAVPSRQLLAAGFLIAGFALAWQFLPAPAVASPTRESLALFPLELGDWRGHSSSLDPEIARVLEADDYLLADFQAPREEAPVNLFIAFYVSQIAGSSIHSPEICIPAGGWEVSRWERVQSEFTLPSGEALAVNRAIVQKGLQRQLVYYWFEQRGRPMTSDLVAKISTVWDAMMRGRTDGALVRLVTPIGGDETMAAAEQRLEGFLEKAYPELPRFIPE